MVFAPASHARQAGGCASSTRAVTRSSPQPCQGHLFYRRVRSERGRIELSKAQVFARGQYPVLGRFNLATPDANAPDAKVRVHGMGLRITTPDGQEWRSAMIDPPVFAVSTPQGFYELLLASKSKDANAMKTFHCGASGVRGVRRLGQERAVDRQLRGRSVQQPQQLHLRGQGRRGARSALVAAAGGASRSPSHRMISPSAALTTSNRKSRSASPARRNAGQWW